MTNDMTTGRPLPLLVKFAVPLTLGNILQQLYNVADSVIAGQFIGVDALAAIGSAGPLMFMVTGWLNGLTSGFAVLLSQSFGAGKKEELRRYAALSVTISFVVTVALTAILLAANRTILGWMNVPQELMGQTWRYTEVIYGGLLATCAYNALSAALRALGDGKTPLYFLLLASVLNVALDIIFIVSFGMDVEGCAWATVIAQGFSAVCCLFYIGKKYEILRLSRADFRYSGKRVGELLALGVPMGLQFSITGIGTVILQGVVNTFGAVCMAGYSAANKLQNIIWIIYFSLATAAGTFVGQNMGAKRMDRIRQGVRTAQWMILVWSVAAIAMVYLAGPYMLRLFVDASETAVIDAAQTFFRVSGWAYPFLGSLCLYRNVISGMGNGWIPMLAGVAELLARCLVVGIVSGWGSYAAVCFADPVAWVASVIPLVPYYLWSIRKQIKKQEKEYEQTLHGNE